MTTTITRISEEEFAKTEPFHQLFIHENARCFARIDLAESTASLVFSWRSDLIEPTLCFMNDNITWVGVDEHLAAVCKSGLTLFSIGLPSPLLTAKLHSRGIVAVCELSAISISSNCSINSLIDFPDIATEFTLLDSCLSVSFIDGSSEEFLI